jgi:hypothetical protein
MKHAKEADEFLGVCFRAGIQWLCSEGVDHLPVSIAFIIVSAFWADSVVG